MKLNTEDQKKLDAKPEEICTDCGMKVRSAYCGKCDEFYTKGHRLDCPTITGKNLENNNHGGPPCPTWEAM